MHECFVITHFSKEMVQEYGTCREEESQMILSPFIHFNYSTMFAIINSTAFDKICYKLSQLKLMCDLLPIWGNPRYKRRALRLLGTYLKQQLREKINAIELCVMAA